MESNQISDSRKEIAKLKKIICYHHRCIKTAALQIKAARIRALIYIYKQNICYRMNLTGYKNKIKLLQKDLDILENELIDPQGKQDLEKGDYIEEKAMQSVIEAMRTNHAKLTYDDFRELILLQLDLSAFCENLKDEMMRDFDDRKIAELDEKALMLHQRMLRAIKRYEFNCGLFDFEKAGSASSFHRSFEQWLCYAAAYSDSAVKIMIDYLDRLDEDLSIS